MIGSAALNSVGAIPGKKGGGQYGGRGQKRDYIPPSVHTPAHRDINSQKYLLEQVCVPCHDGVSSK